MGTCNFYKISLPAKSFNHLVCTLRTSLWRCIFYSRLFGRKKGGYTKINCGRISMSEISGGSKGGARDAPPPGGPNSFIFMQFSAKIIGSHTHFGSWRPPPSGKSWIRHWKYFASGVRSIYMERKAKALRVVRVVVNRRSSPNRRCKNWYWQNIVSQKNHIYLSGIDPRLDGVLLCA